jgi:hypothetical protein
MHAATLTIARLHATRGTHEPLIARLAAEALAAEVATALPPLPPQAVLMLRRLALALPLRALERLPDARLRLQVASAARGAIAAAAAHAGRPALGQVADDAEAVWFGDEAELLACLARDALAGRLNHWWWRQLLGRAFPDWVSAWIDRPAMTAAALRLLARTGQLAAACKVLAPRGVLAMLPAVSDTIPVPAARARGGDVAPAAAPVSAAATPAAVQPARDAVAATRRDDDAAVAAFVAPEHASAQLAAPSTDLPAPARALARTRGAHPTQEASPVAHLATEHTAVALPAIRTAAAPGSTHAVGMAPFGMSAEADRVVHNSDAAPALPAAIDDRATPPARTPPAPVQAATLVRNDTALARTHRPDAPVARLRDAPGVDASPALASPVAVDVPTHAPTAGPAPTLDAAPHVVITHYGRLLFLVNLLLGDGLYPDFTRPLDPAFPLPVWRLLILIGHGLIGPALRDDPLWPLLADLAADGTQTGAVRDLERRWPVPKAPPVRRQAGTNVRFPHPRRLRHAPAGSLARWLARYLQSLRARLAPALATTPALVGRTFAGPAAQLWVSEAELVLVTPLDTHPVAWRLAGLDRDPGPLPGAGRTLRMVFD